MIDRPPPYQPGVLARLGGRFAPGILTVLDTVQARTDEWFDRSLAAVTGDDPLWVALGDSTAQGIGASSIEQSYVGQLRSRLASTGRHFDLVNLARTGARIDDVLGRQLDAVARLPRTPSLITCTVGSNDVMRFDSAAGAPRRMRKLLHGLADIDADVIVATAPQGSSSFFARRLNAAIRSTAPALGIEVADVARTLRGPFDEKVAADRFHPNDRGYTDWAEAFLEPLGL